MKSSKGPPSIGGPLCENRTSIRGKYRNDIHISPHGNFNLGDFYKCVSQHRVLLSLICLSFKIINVFFSVLKSIEYLENRKIPHDFITLTTTVSIHYIMVYFKLSFLFNTGTAQ